MMMNVFETVIMTVKAITFKNFLVKNKNDKDFQPKMLV